MKIPSSLVPQADRLDEVLRAVEAVGRGAITFQDIARALGKVERQGRYYRLAAEILGFLNNSANHAVLTDSGRLLLGASAAEKKSIIRHAVLSMPLVHRLIPFFEARLPGGISRTSLVRFLSEIADLGGDSMAPRRISTVTSWLVDSGVAEIKGDTMRLNPAAFAEHVVTFTKDDEPLFPKAYKLEDYDEAERRIKTRSGLTTVLVDETTKERAEASHSRLIHMMAERIRGLGAVPKANRLIDLSAQVDDSIYLFEMKSTTEDNARSQVRRGLSQLYEYRFVQDIPKAKLVLVIEKQLPGPLQWLVEYLQKDRNIFLVWDGSDNFFASKEVAKALPFL